jgi:chaperonin GroES
MIVLHDLLLIKPTEDKKSVLVLPDNSKEIPQEGTVISQGPDVPENMKGKLVIFRKWLGDIVKYEEKEYIVIKYEDIIGVIDGK